MSGQTGRTIFIVAGTVVGAFFGVPQLGAIAGGLIGTAVFPIELPGITNAGPKLGDLKVQSSTYGTAIPIVFGAVRIAGKLIWAQTILQTEVAAVEDVGDGKGGGNTHQDVTTKTYTYSISCAIDLCEGTIAGVRKIWANNQLIYDMGASGPYESNVLSRSNADAIRIYTGSPTQAADPLIEAVQGSGQTPAYRGVAYVVFENLQLEKFGNRPPNFEFEVVATGSVTSTLLPLDTAYQLGGFAGGGGWYASALASLSAQGQLIAYASSNSPTAGEHAKTRLVLLHPYTLQVLRTFSVFEYVGQYAGSSAAGQFLYGAPQMNADGDVLFTAIGPGSGTLWVWPNGGTPAQPTTPLLDDVYASSTSRDAAGNFYAFGMMYYPDRRPVLIRVRPSSYDPLSSAIEADILWTTAGTQPPYYNAMCMFDAQDGYLWVGLSTQLPGDHRIKSINRTTGAEVSSYTPLTAGTLGAIAVAGDGSVWYHISTDGGSLSKLCRIAPDFLSETVLDTQSSGTVGRLARDWSNGDILYGWIGEVIRFMQDGTERTAYAPGSLPWTDPVTAFDYPASVYVTKAHYASGGYAIAGERSEVVTVGTEALTDVITNLVGRVGVAPSDLTFTGITDNVQGFVIANRGSVRSMLDPLMMGYLLDAVESGSKLKFFKRGGAAVLTIPEDDMGAHSDGSEMVDPLSTQRMQEPELPHELAISYMDIDAHYQVGTQYARRLTGSSANDTAVNLALVLDSTTVRRLCETLLYEAWAARMHYSVPVSQKYAKYEPGDVVNLALDSGTVCARLTGKREGQSIMQLDAIGNDPAVFVQQIDGVAQPDPISTILAPGPTNLQLLDTPLLRDMDDVPGFYAVAGGYGDGWTGAELFKSADGYVYADTNQAFVSAGTVGNTTTALATFSGGNIFDETNTVEVVLSAGALSSVTELEVLGGANAAYLGGEIIHFKTATFITTGKYLLQGLLRGRVGTELKMRGHTIGEVFVLLSSLTVKSIDVASAEIGQARLYKGVSFGTSLGSATPKSITLVANRLKPLSPVQLGGGRNAANDLTINWVRRARSAAGWSDLIDVALDEPTESYEVDVFAGAGVAITAVTRAASGVFTTSGVHSLIVGDVVFITGIAGSMGTLLNDRTYTIDTVPTTTTFTVNLDTTPATAYTSAGTVRKRARTLIAATPTASYTAAQQTTDYGSTQATVYVSIYQLSSRVGRGFPGSRSI